MNFFSIRFYKLSIFLVWIYFPRLYLVYSWFILGLSRHVASDKYVDVDFENVDLELSKKVMRLKCHTFRHFDFKNV
jgi:hypothetical protein